MTERAILPGDDPAAHDLVVMLARASDACPVCARRFPGGATQHARTDPCTFPRVPLEQAETELRALTAARASMAGKVIVDLVDALGNWVPPMIALGLEGGASCLADVTRALGGTVVAEPAPAPATDQ